MIPLFTLERQNKILKKEIDNAIKEVVIKGIFVLGHKVEEFEREFAEYTGTNHAVGVASGTDALTLSLLSVGIGPGDEVIMPANAYPTAFAVAAVGAVPKLVDIDLETYTIDPDKIEEAITKKTKAIIPVHLYGQPAEMESIIRICRYSLKQKIYIIEDCAQAHGAEVTGPASRVSQISLQNRSTSWGSRPVKLDLGAPPSNHPFLNKKVGSVGDLGCFSFYPTKNLGCFGDGGMVVTNDKGLAEKVRLLRMYGERKRYDSVALGRNSRLDELQAAILLVKLKYLDKWNERRRGIARKYLSHLGNLSDLGLPVRQTGYAKHVYHLFVIRTNRRDELKEYLLKKRIQTAVHYPIPVHLTPSFGYLGYKKGDFPESEKACRGILSLPLFPELSHGEVKKVVETIGEWNDA